MIHTIIAQIQTILSTHDRFKNCYFWTPRTNAAGRRAQEFNETYHFENIEVRQALDVSCKNYYYSCYVYVDDVRKDIRALKKYTHELKLIATRIKSLETKMDRNGNRVLKVTPNVGRAFTVQTNGNLPKTHANFNRITAFKELKKYIKKHGTTRQKQIMGEQCAS